MTLGTKNIGVGLIGLGTVGGGVARLLKEQGDLYAQRLGARLEVRGVLVRDVGRARDCGGLVGGRVTDDAEAFFGMEEMPIVVEVAGGRGEVGAHVRRALTMGKHVVTANKSLLAAEGVELFGLARKHGVSIAFEASCAGGIPILTATQFGLMANRVEAVYGILNGTCNYILTRMTHGGQTYEAALKEAQEKGYAEADPTLDVSGRDAAQKLALLASLAFGVRVTDEAVWSEGIDGLEVVDIRLAGELGYEVKLLAIGVREERGEGGECLSLRVHPSFVKAGLPLAEVHGAYNAVSVYGDAVGHTMYYGQGAGRMPTASAVVSDVLNVASGWYARAFSGMNLLWDRHEAGRVAGRESLASRYYVRMQAKDAPGVLARVADVLGRAGISLSAVLQHETGDGGFVPVVIVTHTAKEGALRGALEEVARLDVIDRQPVVIRIVDLPADR